LSRPTQKSQKRMRKLEGGQKEKKAWKAPRKSSLGKDQATKSEKKKQQGQVKSGNFNPAGREKNLRGRPKKEKMVGHKPKSEPPTKEKNNITEQKRGKLKKKSRLNVRGCCSNSRIGNKGETEIKFWGNERHHRDAAPNSRVITQKEAVKGKRLCNKKKTPRSGKTVIRKETKEKTQKMALETEPTDEKFKKKSFVHKLGEGQVNERMDLPEAREKKRKLRGFDQKTKEGKKTRESTAGIFCG